MNYFLIREKDRNPIYLCEWCFQEKFLEDLIKVDKVCTIIPTSGDRGKIKCESKECERKKIKKNVVQY